MEKKINRGKFIVLEGIDGSGISTQAQIIKSWLEKKYEKKVLLTKEPSDGPIGAMIRQVLNKRLKGIDEKSLALLFAADRIDHLKHKILPALNQGSFVICDRYLWSSLAYQGLKIDESWILKINKFSFKPDLIIFIKVKPEVSLQRIYNNRFQIDVFEKKEILKQVYRNYLDILEKWEDSKEKVVIINGENNPDKVTQEIQDSILQTFNM